MNDLKEYKFIMDISKIMILIILLFYGDKTIFFLVACFIFLLMIFRAIKINSRKRFRMYLVFMYVILLIGQLTFFARNLFYYEYISFFYFINKIVAIFLLSLPYLIERFITISKYTEFYFPSVQEINTLSFSELKSAINSVQYKLKGIDKIKNSISVDKLEEIAKDFPRHSSIKYINNGSLTEEYFKVANDSLKDPYIYIIISNTGSAASELISIFTKKQYNHASLAFDLDLETIISYNGGEKIYPPGLNREMIEFFNKKKDSSIIVYKLKASQQQKKQLIAKVKEINEEGSAYNMLGLVLRSSYKPNIMFCSQFVYKMLKYVDLEYFSKKDGQVKPTDLVELDYHRKLEFCYEIFLNE
ncbi:hypothetical protein [Clostridium grantii]|uniref:Permuted papain-like amidase enzyme, YaeF/YiiX, C92 family n=1 Tax=Clostridium grantii DSM 8605 TaxID=1121316 RepID=A0A1M5VZ99_9CLOT|nr:hypothetical protein [Clostridium grantii]SHH80649.1 hypothetical protein SAMN02745207_02578 [Clostridium grantii DSM 8605]